MLSKVLGTFTLAFAKIGPVFHIYSHKYLLWLLVYKQTYEQQSRKLV